MSNLNKACRRDRKIKRKKYGHTMDNRSIFVIQETQRKQAEKIKREWEERRKEKEGDNHSDR